MRFVVQDIKDITDSRELLESKPQHFTSIFIYLVLTLLCSALVWCCFSEKELVVKASGIVRPSKEIYKVAITASSKVKSINFKNGQIVKSGDVLCTLDYTELDLQKKSNEDKIETINQDVENLKKLKSCILDDKNYFDKNNDKVKEYYNKYLNYEKYNSRSLSDSNSISDSKKDLNLKIDGYYLLQKSVNENKNYVSLNTLYSEQYNNYKISQKQLKGKIEDVQKQYNSLKLTKNVDKNSILQAESALNASKTELDKFTSDYKLKINSSIEDLKSKNKELDNSLNKINDTSTLNKEKNKSTTSVQLEDDIKVKEEKLKDLKDNLKVINMNIEKCEIKVPNDGILDIQIDINIGDVVQAGTVVANILPTESKYKVDLLIADKDVANIKEGQKIKYSFPSLPYKEYGFLSGKLEKISADSKINKSNGNSFYTTEAGIDVSKVYSHKGEESKIRNGMTCVAQIVTRKEKMLYYLLEKLNLKE